MDDFLYPEIISRTFPFGEVTFIREETLSDYVHACTLSDIENLIGKLPASDMEGIRFIVFHQPTRKTDMQSPRWAAYYAEYPPEKPTGSAIFLEAIRPSVPMKWPTSLTPEDQKELAYLDTEGHRILRGKKEIVISTDVDSARRTVLKRSFIHELGHHVDYKRDPKSFSARTRSEKEAFANKYFFGMSKHVGNSD